MNILVIGQSHVAAIRDAARVRREADPDRPRTRVIHTLEPRYAPEIEDEAGPAARFSPALLDTIRDQIDRHRPRVASVIGGNYHNALALVRHPRPFDFHLSGEPSPPLDPQAEPVPEALVRAALEAGLARDRLRLTLLHAAIGPFVHLESPPPVRDDRFIAAAADAYFRARGIARDGVAPAAVRYRIWRLNSGLFRTMVEELGGTMLPVPPGVQDVDGFLRPDLAADATHGNAAYGEAMIRMLEGHR